MGPSILPCPAMPSVFMPHCIQYQCGTEGGASMMVHRSNAELCRGLPQESAKTSRMSRVHCTEEILLL